MTRRLQTHCGTKVLVAFLALLIDLSSTAHGQTTAAEWFQKGLAATATNDQITAFEKTTQLDPNYVEAYFYLGLAYKAGGLLPEAEVALNKAYFTNPYALASDIKGRILFELGSLYAATGKPEKAQDALKGAKDLGGGNRALKGRIALELGRVYLNKNQYSLAQAEFEDGRQLWPQNAREFDRLMAEISGTRAVNDAYLRGLDLLQSERFQDAVRAFDQVLSTQPGFRDAVQKRQQAEAGLNRLKQSNDLNALYEQAEKLMRSGEIDEAINRFEQVANVDAAFRDVDARLGQLRREAGAQNQTQALERAYARGQAAINRGDWQRALNYLASVRNMQAGYKDVSNLISRANRELGRLRQQETRLNEMYGQAMQYVQNEQWREALSILKKLQDQRPGFRDVDEQLLEIRDTIARQPDQNSELENLYQQGTVAEQNQDWLQASMAFERVKLLNPEYKDVKDRLGNARKLLARSTATTAETGSASSVLLLIGATLSLFILPVAGILAFSPTTRARMYLLQGNYTKAAMVYEAVLEKKPERVKLYLPLANIYLLENRHDIVAIRIFEMILKLNILMPRRNEINSIVANHYLNQGRTDSNAIAIMERELSNKISKLESGAA